MAFTKAAEVAALVKRHVLPGVVVSIGQAEGVPGLEVVIRGFSHPDDGMSRLWHIELRGPSGPMLDMVIIGLRKAGFELSGSAPLLKGVLTQVLDRVERARMNAAARKQEEQIEKAQFKAELSAETMDVQREAARQIEEPREKLASLEEMVGDIALMPSPRGPQGPAGPAGQDGKDGTAADLEDAELKDLGVVLSVDAEDRQVLTWKDGKMAAPLCPPRLWRHLQRRRRRRRRWWHLRRVRRQVSVSTRWATRSRTLAHSRTCSRASPRSRSIPTAASGH